MEQEELREQVLRAWIGLNGMLKNSRVTQGLPYNEAVVMKLVYDQYRADGTGRTAVGQLTRQTHMLKSQVNRTVNSLCAQGYLVKERDGADARVLFVRPRPEGLADFLAVHRRSLALARSVIDVIGAEDAACFVRIYEKLSDANLQLTQGGI